MNIYIYTQTYIDRYIYYLLVVFVSCSPNKRSFRGPGGVGRRQDLGCQAKIIARELASVASRFLQRPPSPDPGFQNKFSVKNILSKQIINFLQISHILNEQIIFSKQITNFLRDARIF